MGVVGGCISPGLTCSFPQLPLPKISVMSSDSKVRGISIDENPVKTIGFLMVFGL